MTTKPAWQWRNLWEPRALLAYGLTALVMVGLFFVLKRMPQVSVASVTEALRRFPWGTLAFVFLLWSIQNLASSVRLHVLLEDEARGSLLETWQAISVGQWFNAFLPARIGDAMKLFLVNRRHPGHGFSIAGTLVADRVADLSALACVLIVAGAAEASAFRLPAVSGRVVLGVLLGVAAVGLGTRFFLPRHWRTKARDAARGIAHGFAGLKRPGPLLVATLVSVLGWLCESSSLIVLVRSQGFAFSPSEGVYLLFLLNVATAVPVSVGQMGTFEASIVYALGTRNVPTTPALAVALMHHLLYFGMLCFWALVTTAWVKWKLPGATSRAEPEPAVPAP